MNLFTVAIGKKYEIEAQRLENSLSPLNITIFTSNDVQNVTDNPVINGYYHKTNFANYINSAEGPVIFMDADMFTLSDNPFQDFSVAADTEFAFVPYPETWHLPDETRQSAYDFLGCKINSGFLYFKDLETAKRICTEWQQVYLERENNHVGIRKNKNSYEYDEWSLMIAIQNLNNIKTEHLDVKWNNWDLNEEYEIRNSDSIFFQSHFNLNIIY